MWFKYKERTGCENVLRTFCNIYNYKLFREMLIVSIMLMGIRSSVVVQNFRLIFKPLGNCMIFKLKYDFVIL